MKEKFISALISTARASIKMVVERLEEVGFFSAPASINHQNNYAGGLLEHSVSVYECALELRKQRIAEYPELEEKLPLDSVVLVSLLHDVCKSDIYFLDSEGKYYKDYSKFPCGHGEKSVIMLLRMGLELTDDEVLAIRWHMGEHEANPRSQEYGNLKQAEKQCPLLQLLQDADGMASHLAIAKKRGDLLDIWNSVRWQNGFRQALALEPGERVKQLRTLRRKAYQAVLKIVRQGDYITEEGRMVRLPLNPNIEDETVFCSRQIRMKEPTHEYATQVAVVGADCLDFAKELVAQEGSDSVCVLNLASWRRPGGGVLGGAGAQEEYLFRCTDYYRSLYQYVDEAPSYGVRRNSRHSYPLNEQYGGIFSRGVTVFRENEATGYKLLAEPWRVNFIAVAAHKDPATVFVDGETRLVDSEIHFMEEKVRTILRIALRNHQTTLVLGALGCGAFHNPPKHVAEIFKSVIAEEEFSGVFKAIYFAILDDHNSHGNLASFQKVFA